jgi:hypothetical protein
LKTSLTHKLWIHEESLTSGEIGQDRIGKSNWEGIRHHSIAMTDISELNNHGIQKKKPALVWESCGYGRTDLHKTAIQNV